MEVTRPRLFFTHVLLAICLGAIALPSGVARGQSILDAVKYEELVVCLNNDGRFLAWDIKNGEFKPDLAAGLSKVKLARMGSNGKRIWGVQEKKLLEWSPGTKAWGEVAKFDAGGEELAGIAVVGEMSFLIFPRKVLSPIDRHTFEVPQLQGQFNDLRKLRVLRSNRWTMSFRSLGLGAVVVLWLSGNSAWRILHKAEKVEMTVPV